MCRLYRVSVQQQIMYWSLSRHWLVPTHSLPADTVLSDPTPSIVLFHAASSPFTSKKKNQVHFLLFITDIPHIQPNGSFLEPEVRFSAICPSRTLVCLLFIQSLLERWVLPQRPLSPRSASLPPLSLPCLQSAVSGTALMMGVMITGAIMTSNGGNIQ